MSTDCQGILGWLFGHKFIKTVRDYTYNAHNCFRCGMPRGGRVER